MTQEGGAEERLLDLIIKRAVEGLDLDEAREFGVLSSAHPDVRSDDIDQIIAALDAAPLGEERPLPESVAVGVAQRLTPILPASPPAQPGKLPWLAAAAALTVAAIGWWQALSAEPRVTRLATGSGRFDVPAVSAPPSERERIDADAAALSIAWAAPANAIGPVVLGAVHWSNTHQTGYMELGGLGVNDPSVEQYQLWIFDQTRSQDHPVDGGVFDITRTGMQVVPIRATLWVRRATLFAVTVEVPGGVMVSDRQRMVAQALVAAN